MKKGIIVMLLAVFASFSVSAQSTVKQNKRITQGVVSGELTAKETRQLKKQQRKLKKTKKRARRDGVITPKEQLKITKQEARLNKNIYRQKHDGQEQRRRR